MSDPELERAIDAIKADEARPMNDHIERLKSAESDLVMLSRAIREDDPHNELRIRVDDILAEVRAAMSALPSTGEDGQLRALPASATSFIVKILVSTPNGEWVRVQYHPNGDWSVASVIDEGLDELLREARRMILPGMSPSEVLLARDRLDALANQRSGSNG